MKKVYLINCSFAFAGIERRFANVWKVLDKRGIVKPILIIPRSLAEKLKQANIFPDKPESVIIVPENNLMLKIRNWILPGKLNIYKKRIMNRFVIYKFNKIFKEIENETNSVFHIGLPCSALNFPDIPTVYECVDSTFKRLNSKHYQKATNKYCIIHCQTERIRNRLDMTFPLSKKKWKTVSNPIYFAHYERTKPILEKANTVVFVGRFFPEKNPLLFIESIAIVRKKYKTLNVIMLGEGFLEPEMKRLIKKHNLEEIISIGFSKNVYHIISKALIFVSLQTFDNFGSQSLLEAMGAGCAIIASDVGETKKIITEKVGLRTELTPEAVSSAILFLLNSSEYTKELGKNAALIARSKYSVDKYAEFLESLYEEAFSYYHIGSSNRLTQNIYNNIN